MSAAPQVDTQAAENTKLKHRFAELMLRLDDPYKAGQQLFPGETQKALYVARIGPTDPEVVAEMERLLAEKGRKAFLPTKEELARDIYNRAQACGRDIEGFLKASELFAKVMGYVEKPGNVAPVQIQNVMVIPSQGDKTIWGQRAGAAQQALMQGD